MKNTKRGFALLVALVLVLGAFGAPSFADKKEGDGKVTISCSKQRVEDGQSVTLTAHPSGFGEGNLVYQWQIDKGDGWQDIKKATKPDYSFTYEDDMVSYQWRVIVDREKVEEPEATLEPTEAPEETLEPTEEPEQTLEPEQSEQPEAEPSEEPEQSAEPKAEETHAAEETETPKEPAAEQPSEPQPEPAKAEEPKHEEPKAEEPKAEEPKHEEPKPEPKHEEPKQESIPESETPLSAGLDTDGDGEIDISADIENPANGDLVTLSTPLSEVENDGGLLYQWMVDRGDGLGFTPIEGATGKTYAYTHSDACQGYVYRVAVSVATEAA